jgi:ribosomal protein S18 acetylase RimI-like enzyme
MIRRASLHDLPGVYRVCLQTGDSGNDATAMYRNPDLLGHLYAGPYVVGEPELAFVVTDRDGVGGYLLAAERTRAFEAWADEHWWPALGRDYPMTDGDTRDHELIRQFHSPPRAPDAVVAAYPAHLHIDLLPRMRGRGLGRALIAHLLDVLRRRGSAGVHLEVGSGNQNAIEFYRHLGFMDLERTRDSIYMGMRLD